MKTITIEHEDGSTTQFVGTIVEYSESIDSANFATVDGHSENVRVGTGAVSLTIKYVNGPIDVPTGGSR